MNESKLTDLLERAADRTAVNPPPIDAMRSGATRRRRRRTALWSTAGTALAVAAAIGGTTALTGGPAAEPPVAKPPVAKPAVETRTVAVGRVGVAVPISWPTNAYKCGRTPERSTVIIDPNLAEMLCLAPYPAGAQSVRLERSPEGEFRVDSTITIGGESAQRQATRCEDEWNHKLEVCTGAVWFPDLKVWVQASSAGDAAAVDRLLAGITVVQDSVGVPGYHSSEVDRKMTKYADELRRAGLKWRTVTSRGPATAKGRVLAVSPAVGTVLRDGETVTVTVGR